jgi:aquaporin Z
MKLLRAVLAEAIGTFGFLTVGLLSLVSATAIGQGDAHVILLAVPFGFGLGLFAAIWLVGHVSGGHFNPAVTLGALLDGRITIVGAIGYVIGQLVGAFGAAFMIYFVVGQNFVAYTITQPAVAAGPAFLTETILTAIFVGVILTVTERQPKVAAFAIGLTLTVIHFAAIPITGASVNPARSLAPAIVSGHYDDLWIYLTAPFLGALIGWGVYRLFGGADADEAAEEDEGAYEDEDDLDDDLEEEAAG